jgi:hypothetical protein
VAPSARLAIVAPPARLAIVAPPAAPYNVIMALV